MAGEIALERRASGTAPVKRPSTYKIVGKHLPRLDLPAKVAGAGFIHDIAPENVLHARVLRQPWRGAHLAALDENAVRKAAKAPIDILREGEFVAFTADSEIAVMRAAEAARTLAQMGGRHAAARRRRHAGLAQGADLARQDHRHRASPAARRTGRAVEASYSRPFLTYGSIGHVLRARRVQGRRAQGLVALAGPGGAARLARPRARACPPRRSTCSTARAPAPTATTPPTTPPSMPPSSPCAIRAAPCACSGRARTSSPPRRSAPRWRSRSAPCSTPTTSPPTGRSKSGARRTPSGPA